MAAKTLLKSRCLAPFWRRGCYSARFTVQEGAIGDVSGYHVRLRFGGGVTLDTDHRPPLLLLYKLGIL